MKTDTILGSLNKTCPSCKSTNILYLSELSEILYEDVYTCLDCKCDFDEDGKILKE